MQQEKKPWDARESWRHEPSVATVPVGVAPAVSVGMAALLGGGSARTTSISRLGGQLSGQLGGQFSGATGDAHAAQILAAAIAAERLLLDAADRALRSPRGKLALALHLSRLKPPAPRPHHLRIARALLQDTAQRHSGQVFPLRNGDLVLLCTASGAENRQVTGQASPATLPISLGRAFGADGPDDHRLTSFWRLEEDGEQFRSFLAARQTDQVAEPMADEGVSHSAALLTLEEQLANGALPDMLSQQTAIMLNPGRHLPMTARLAPLFRELTFSLEALTERRETADALGDPFLFRHFASRLDARMLEHLHADLEQGGKLTRNALRENLPLHLNLTLDGIVSPAFARLAEVARRTGARFGVEVSLMEASADPALMEYAGKLLALAGFPLVIDGLTHVGLPFANPMALGPAMVKLIWSPRLAEPAAPTAAAIAAAIGRIGPERLVLQNVETEAALTWGQAHGILYFQGYYLDAMQAAARIAGCHSARACTLRQCLTRAGTLNPAGRIGCGNPGLLDTIPDFRGAAARKDQSPPNAARRAN